MESLVSVMSGNNEGNIPRRTPLPPRRLGDFLLENGRISPEQLRVAKAETDRTGELLGAALVRLGYVTNEDVTVALAEQAGIALVDLDGYDVDYELIQSTPEAFLRKHEIVPIKREGFTVTAASANPTNVAAVDELQGLTQCFVTMVAARESQIQALLDRAFMKPKGAPKAQIGITPAAETPRGVDRAQEASVTRLVDDLFRKAAREGATDIHIEPQEKAVATRFRYDGMLQAGVSLPRSVLSGVVTRVKILANMNISESRLPQDGRLSYEGEGKRLELRVSSMPTIYGESLAIRVLDKGRTFGLATLGLSQEQTALFRRLILHPHGLILVTGPTGSGKTTTLYSALLELNSVEKNVMTLEDPVEYELPMIRQSQINPRSGFSFAAGLRAILRHDPDVILVGEMRDLETVEISIRAALTGHLVFSTLHTNDAVGTIPRLTEMGVEPYLVGSSLLGVLGQRLVRTICGQCRTEIDADPATLMRLGEHAKDVPRLFKGKGCSLCNFTGYRGRTAVFEFLEITPPLADLIAKRAAPEALVRQAREGGMEAMFQDGVKKVAAGITTVDEVVRVIHLVE